MNIYPIAPESFYIAGSSKWMTKCVSKILTIFSTVTDDVQKYYDEVNPMWTYNKY